jgi:hypothetical protein
MGGLATKECITPQHLEGHLDGRRYGVVATAICLQQLALELLHKVLVVRELKQLQELLACLRRQFEAGR